MDLNTFLGFLHDKFIPRDLRKCIDTFDVNINTDKMISASRNVNRDGMFHVHQSED